MLTNFIFSLAASVAAQEAHGQVADPWIADFDVAVEVAKKVGKDLLVDFTGSDWCGWCIKLHDEVFSHQEFIDGATDDFVLVALDFPRGNEAKGKVPNPKRNQELQQKYEIQGFPTILLLTPEGELFGKSSYAAGGPVPWVKSLDTIRESGKKAMVEVPALEKKLAFSKGAELTKLVDSAIAMLATMPQDQPFNERLATLARGAYTADANNAAGRKLKAVAAVLKARIGTDADLAIAAELDPKNANGLREHVVIAHMGTVDSEEKVKEVCKEIDELDALGPIHDQEIAKQIYTTAAFWNDKYVKSPDAAKKYAKKVKDLGVDDPELEKALDKILAG